MVRMSLATVRGFNERAVSSGIPRWKKLVRSELHAKQNGTRVISRRRTAIVALIDPRGRFALIHVFARRTSGGEPVKAVIPRENFPRGKRLHEKDIIVLDLLSGDPSPVGCRVEIRPHGSLVRVP